MTNQPKGASSAERARLEATRQCWKDMKQRCLNPKNRSFKNYGARGITVCSEWLEFDRFFSDMGLKPDGLTLERIDNDGNYEASNCKWLARHEQRLNQRNCRYVELNGERVTLRRAAQIIGMRETTLQHRLDYQGMSFDEAISKPLRCPRSSVLRTAPSSTLSPAQRGEA